MRAHLGEALLNDLMVMLVVPQALGPGRGRAAAGVCKTGGLRLDLARLAGRHRGVCSPETSNRGVASATVFAGVACLPARPRSGRELEEGSRLYYPLHYFQ